MWYFYVTSIYLLINQPIFPEHLINKNINSYKSLCIKIYIIYPAELQVP